MTLWNKKILKTKTKNYITSYNFRLVFYTLHVSRNNKSGS